MNLSILLAEKIASLFLMMLAGFLLVKLKILKSSDSRLLSLISTYVFIPSMVLKSFQIDSNAESIRDILILLTAALLIHAVFISLALLLRRSLKLTNIEQASLIYTNCGNLITPLVASIFGTDMLFCSSIFATVQILIIWTHGYALVCQERTKNLREVLLNFNIIVALISLALFILKIQLPDIIMDTLDGLSSMMGPAGMLILGMLIAGADLTDVFSRPRTFFIAMLRLIAYPLFIILLFKALRLSNYTSSPEVLMISLMAAAAPSANTIINMTQINNIDARPAVSINIVTTILCIITMPLVIQLYQWIIG